MAEEPVSDPMGLYAKLHPYGPGEYDFPNEGQAIHELLQVMSDPHRTAAAPPRLEQAARLIRSADVGYRLARRNSNTVIGSLLRASGALNQEEEAELERWPVSLRAAGISFDLGLGASPGPARGQPARLKLSARASRQASP